MGGVGPDEASFVVVVGAVGAVLVEADVGDGGLGDAAGAVGQQGVVVALLPCSTAVVDDAHGAGVLVPRQQPLVLHGPQPLRRRVRLGRCSGGCQDLRLGGVAVDQGPDVPGEDRDAQRRVTVGVPQDAARVVQHPGGVERQPEELAGAPVQPVQVQVEAAQRVVADLTVGEVPIVDQGRDLKILDGRRSPVDLGVLPHPCTRFLSLPGQVRTTVRPVRPRPALGIVRIPSAHPHPNPAAAAAPVPRRRYPPPPAAGAWPGTEVRPACSTSGSAGLTASEPMPWWFECRIVSSPLSASWR